MTSLLVILQPLSAQSPFPRSTWQATWAWPWWSALLVFVGILLSCWLLYRRERMTPARRFLLGSLRAAALMLMVWMLFGWTRSQFRIERSELAIVIDRSESMALPVSATNSTSRMKWIQSRVDSSAFRKLLSERYQLRYYSIGTGLSELATDNASVPLLESIEPNLKSSRLGEDLRTLLTTSAGRPISAVLLMTDGQVTSGIPLPQAAMESATEPNLKLPIYPLPLGDLEPQINLTVTHAQAMAIALPGDLLEVQIDLRTSGLAQAARATLVDSSGRLLDEQQVTLDASGLTTLTLAGLVSNANESAWSVVVDPLPGENETNDNRLPVTIRVREDPLRVLLVADAPSYEFRFLKHLLERTSLQNSETPLLELTSVLQQGDPRYADQDRTATRLPPSDDATLDQLDVIVLLDTEPEGLGRSLMERMAQRVQSQGTGLVVIAGPRHLPGKLVGTPLEKLLPAAVRVSTARANRAGPWQPRLTPLGQTERALQFSGTSWDVSPAWSLLATEMNSAPGTRVLMEAAHENGGPPQPLLMLRPAGAGSVLMLLSDESFRLASLNGSDEPHESFWLQLLRRLARGRQQLPPDKAELSVRPQRASVGEAITITATLGENLQSTIEQAGEGTAVTFRPADSATLPETTLRLVPDTDQRQRHSAEIADLTPGRWTVRLQQPATDAAEVSFEVLAPPTELSRTHADVASLRATAEASGGALLMPEESIESWLDRLPQTPPISVEPLPPRPLWNHPLVLFLLVALLCTEWALRRWWGLL